MAFKISSLPGPFGASIDIGDNVKMEDLSESDRESLRATFTNNSVTLVRGISLDPVSHVRLTRLLGEPEIHPVASLCLPGHPEVIEVVHTPDMNGGGPSEPARPDELVGQLDWHADLMYMPNPSCGALVRALEVPEEGGETAFVDTTMAYERLDDSMKRHLIGKRAVYRLTGELIRARNKTVDERTFSEVLHPLLHKVPGTEKIALNISPAAIRIDGMEEEQSRRLSLELHEHTIQDRFMYVHQWQASDLIIWNNLRALHSARGHKRSARRILHRTTLKGGALDPLTL